MNHVSQITLASKNPKILHEGFRKSMAKQIEEQNQKIAKKLE
jgi:hypothetical protein